MDTIAALLGIGLFLIPSFIVYALLIECLLRGKWRD